MAKQTPEEIAAESEHLGFEDSNQLAEYRLRMASNGVPTDGFGRPMAKVMGGCSDKLPTVQFGNVVIGPAWIERWIVDEGPQSRVDGLRTCLRECEFAVGIERRLLQLAVDPAAKFRSPVDGQEAFAAPPPGYDASKLGDPAAIADAAVQQHIANEKAAAEAAAAQQPPVPPAVPQPDPMPPRMDTHQASQQGNPGVSIG